MNSSRLARWAPILCAQSAVVGDPHTREGYAFQQHATEAGFREAVRARDEPFEDLGRSTFKG